MTHTGDGNQSDNERPDRPSKGKNRADSKKAARITVVGIGASAGGLRPLRTFFEGIPARTGMAFVVVIHLSPEHESSMAELLQMSAAIPVVQVTHRLEIEPDHVYVIPPNKNIQITDSHLDLKDFEQPRGRRSPIDFFFRTLADRHPDGVAILFSGGGADGVVGMKAVKEHGGLLMAQIPEEADHDQMPRSAIATGLVDFVLPAKELAEKLVEIRRKGAIPAIPISPEKLSEGEEQIIKQILTQVHTRTGHDFSGYKRSTLLRRIARRMRVASVTSSDQYLAYLRGNSSEVRALLKDFLISVTSFFRDAEAFEALAEQVIPKFFEKKTPQDEIRIWVAGCATGEEAYSIAMLLLEHAATVETRPRIQVFATDLDEDALLYARDGLYPHAISTDISEGRLMRFFTREGAYYRVSKDLRKCVLFAAHNLLNDPPFANLDLIACRNLLIYLRRELQTRVFDVFRYALRADGYLILGGSEGIGRESDSFQTIDQTHRIYRCKPHPPGHAKNLPDLPIHNLGPGRTIRPPAMTDAVVPQPESYHQLHRVALEAHAPPSILVDHDHRIIHLSDTAGRYLQHPGGRATLNLVTVAREEFRIELRAALHDALERRTATIARPVELRIEGEPRRVQLYVRPVPQDGGSPLALVIFAEEEVYERARGSDGSPPDSSDERTLQVERELERLKSRLQVTIEESETQQEELKSANEELQSINEEYKSTLEELETSKEELQSVNEELKTVNEELTDMVEALSRSNNDLKNLMAATDVATLFLDRDLRVRRYTQPLTRVFNIMPVDEGRPLSHITHRLRSVDLSELAREVLDLQIPMEREMQDDQGRDYLVRMAPYRTTDDRIKGVVVTFVDVTRVKKAEHDLQQTQERYGLLVRSVREYAIFMIDPEGRVASWNSGAEHLFGYSEEETLGKPFELIFIEEDARSGAPQAVIDTAQKEGQAVNERWYLRKNGDRFWGSGILTALYDASGDLHGFAKVLRDNTHRREAALALEKSQQRLTQLNEALEKRVEERTADLTRAHDRLRDLASELVRAEQRERHRIAQLLHDDLQQRLYGIQMKAALIGRDVAKGTSDRFRDHVVAIEKMLAETIQRTRELSVDLSPPILMNEGLTEALNWLASQMRERHDLTIKVNAEESFYMEDEGLRTLLFQIIRELLFNVVKHAGVDRATVDLERDSGGLVIRVHDAGAGFSVQDVISQSEREGGFGLSNARERLHFVGGRLEIDSETGTGTHVVVRVPVDAV